VTYYKNKNKTNKKFKSKIKPKELYVLEIGK
jgi:hypothetical protein